MLRSGRVIVLALVMGGCASLVGVEASESSQDAKTDPPPAPTAATTTATPDKIVVVVVVEAGAADDGAACADTTCNGTAPCCNGVCGNDGQCTASCKTENKGCNGSDDDCCFGFFCERRGPTSHACAPCKPKGQQANGWSHSCCSHQRDDDDVCL